MKSFYCLKLFFNPNKQNNNNDTGVLMEILNELRKPQTASATINISQREFANIILDLNRNNQRLAV